MVQDCSCVFQMDMAWSQAHAGPDPCRYYSFTARPLCFADMRDRLRRRQYRTWGDLLADFELICENALAYNNKRSRVHRAAVTLQHAGQILLQVRRCSNQRRAVGCCARDCIVLMGS